MVTVFGIFIGPMLIPMLLGLSRRVTWRGAATGITAGLISGLSFYFYKTLVLAKQPGIDPNWLRYDYEAISILTNFAVTLLAILLVSAVEKVSAGERASHGRGLLALLYHWLGNRGYWFAPPHRQCSTAGRHWAIYKPGRGHNDLPPWLRFLPFAWTSHEKSWVAR